MSKDFHISYHFEIGKEYGWGDKVLTSDDGVLVEIKEFIKESDGVDRIAIVSITELDQNQKEAS